MKNLRKHGGPPFTVAVIHGGPGAAGQMKPVAEELSHMYGTLEPLQTAISIDGQVKELHLALKNHGTLPVTLIGHSWGAWLAFLYAARYSSSVKKLLLVSSGPFEEHYASQITNQRLDRLNEKEKMELDILMNGLMNPEVNDKEKIFSKMGKITLKSDSFNPLHCDDEGIEYRYDIFQSVWDEAEEMRRSGKLLMIGRQIRCPVVAIHGDYDPHPFQGVEEPLSHVVKEFKFILLKNCGHYPWIEREERNNFYDILFEELR
jgi:pimeloyl-ACP methyl ester carboxylesterase